MKEQHLKFADERDQLVESMNTCEKLLSDCSIDKFSELRHQLKQVKEKLRLLNQFNRMK